MLTGEQGLPTQSPNGQQPQTCKHKEVIGEYASNLMPQNITMTLPRERSLRSREAFAQRNVFHLSFNKLSDDGIATQLLRLVTMCLDANPFASIIQDWAQPRA